MKKTITKMKKLIRQRRSVYTMYDCGVFDLSSHVYVPVDRFLCRSHRHWPEHLLLQVLHPTQHSNSRQSVLAWSMNSVSRCYSATVIPSHGNSELAGWLYCGSCSHFSYIASQLCLGRYRLHGWTGRSPATRVRVTVSILHLRTRSSVA